jgi:hypothetical protein
MMPVAKGTQNENFEDISLLNRILSDRTMGVETPIPPITICAAAPDGALPRRIKTVGIMICRFSWFGREPDRFMLVSTE